MTSADDVAQWMIDEIRDAGTGGVQQEVLVARLADRFGVDATRVDAQGRTAVARRVLVRFRALHHGAVQWDRDRFAWEWVGLPGSADDAEPSDA